jgi:histone H4
MARTKQVVAAKAKTPKAKKSPKPKVAKKSPVAKSPKAKTSKAKKSPKPKVAKSPKAKTPKSKKVAAVSRSNLEAITNPAITRLARMAGVKKVGSDVFPEVRNVIHTKVDMIVKHALTYMEHAHRRKLMLDDVKHAYESWMGKKMYGTAPNKFCAKHQRTKGAGGKMKPGNLALIQIKFYQKQHDCFMVQMTPFNRLIKEVLHKHRKDTQISREAINAIHHMCEMGIVGLLEDANLVAIHSKRKGIRGADVVLAHRLRHASHH